MISALRLYQIQNDIDHYATGRLPNGNQVLMGVQLPEIVLVRFDAEGEYRDVLTRDIPGEFVLNRSGILSAESIPLTALMEKWQEEIGYQPATIAVRKFFLKARWIGIHDLPDHYRAVLDGEESEAEDDREETMQEIQAWQDSGCFVLWFTEDYYLNREGELESS